MSMTDTKGGGLLPLEGGVNFRDMGGYQANDGRVVRSGLLFRSGVLSDLTAKDRERLEALSITTILDYRDIKEAAQAPDRLWEGVRLIEAPAIASVTGRTADPEKLIGELLSEKPASKEDVAVKIMEQLYSELPFSNPAYKRLFELLLSDAPTQGLVQHCTLGKDRTGVGSALTLLALGVPVETVRCDYMKTEDFLKCHRREILTQKLQAVMNTTLSEEQLTRLSPLLEARVDYIDHALNSILTRYGTFEAYFKQEFGLSPIDIERLQKRYLQ